ncbi:DUF2635 domain-containing protein [uncultured Deefgea sp.]|uniref:DUF2635 domain-containing protein n=1 Tax=uncultured Deefgea sp. TaxID=1304914 RepID=UPI002592C8E7|nr:DUF2635 domain-containing protein [uncultured Deefgea sp.]
MKVIAQTGIQVPMADNPRRYITDAGVVDVPDDTYYHRRIADGDLRLATNEDLAAERSTTAVSDVAEAVAVVAESAPTDVKPRRKPNAIEGEQ